MIEFRLPTAHLLDRWPSFTDERKDHYRGAKDDTIESAPSIPCFFSLPHSAIHFGLQSLVQNRKQR
jgi:hypothetical protein